MKAITDGELRESSYNVKTQKASATDFRPIPHFSLASSFLGVFILEKVPERVTH